jgi:hypothetical protein
VSKRHVKIWALKTHRPELIGLLLYICKVLLYCLDLDTEICILFRLAPVDKSGYNL